MLGLGWIVASKIFEIPLDIYGICEYNVAMKLRVAYAKRRYKEKVYVTPLLVHSYRDENGIPRNKTIFNLSMLPTHAVIALENALRFGSSTSLGQADVRYRSSVPFGDILAVKHLMDELGIGAGLGVLSEPQQQMALAMIVNRVTVAKPLSVRALADSWSKSSLPLITGRENPPKLDYWYNTLSALYRNQEAIEAELYRVRVQVPGGRTGAGKRVFLYDITSVYLEGEHCPLAAFGYNRDGKRGKKQIVIGLLTDESGYPLATEVFKGNTSDQTTLGGQMKRLRERFGAERLIFIGDRGMVTSARIEEFESGFFGLGVDFITALKRKDMMELVERQDSPVQLGLFDHHNLAEVVDGNRRYILCHNPNRKEEDSTTRERLLFLTERKLMEIAKAVASGRLKKKDKILQRLYKWIDRWKMAKFFKVEVGEGRFSYKRDEGEIERYSRLDGCYVLVTSVPREELGKGEVQRRYKSLAQVERDFRTLKSIDLEVRPVRLWTEEHVRGHVFMCSLALRVTHEARRRLSPVLERDEHNRECEGGSLREVWEDLGRFSVGYLKVGDQLIHQVGEPSEEQVKILWLLGVPTGKGSYSKVIRSE